MTFTSRMTTFVIKTIVDSLCRIYDEPLARVPEHGPLLIVSNHTNFLEGPVIYTHLYPRKATGYAAAKSWINPIFGFIFNQWNAISIKRGEPDLTAIRSGINALKQGLIMAIAPEGTRSGDGRLKRGRPGVVILAQKSNAPILPIAHYGGETFWKNLKRLRRTDFKIIVGQEFYLNAEGVKINNDIRQQIVDEIMYQIAALLPEEYRGYYSDLSKATEKYLKFPPHSKSNLPFALEHP